MLGDQQFNFFAGIAEDGRIPGRRKPKLHVHVHVDLDPGPCTWTWTWTTYMLYMYTASELYTVAEPCTEP